MADVFLRSVPSDSDRDDTRLYDPTQADAGGSATVTGAGGIASEEAVGAPLVLVQGEAIGGFSPALMPPRRLLPHEIAGVGGIASAEAVGRPVLELVGRSRRRREEEWLLRRAA